MEHDFTKEEVKTAYETAIEVNKGWHCDVGPDDFILPFLKVLSRRHPEISTLTRRMVEVSAEHNYIAEQVIEQRLADL